MTTERDPENDPIYRALEGDPLTPEQVRTMSAEEAGEPIEPEELTDADRAVLAALTDY